MKTITRATGADARPKQSVRNRRAGRVIDLNVDLDSDDNDASVLFFFSVVLACFRVFETFLGPNTCLLAFCSLKATHFLLLSFFSISLLFSSKLLSLKVGTSLSSCKGCIFASLLLALSCYFSFLSFWSIGGVY